MDPKQQDPSYKHPKTGPPPNLQKQPFASLGSRSPCAQTFASHILRHVTFESCQKTSACEHVNNCPETMLPPDSTCRSQIFCEDMKRATSNFMRHREHSMRSTLGWPAICSSKHPASSRYSRNGLPQQCSLQRALPAETSANSCKANALDETLPRRLVCCKSRARSKWATKNISGAQTSLCR